MLSVSRVALAFSKTTGAAPTAAWRMTVSWGTNSATRRNFSWNSLLAIRPLGSSPRVEPSMNSGASLRALASAVTLRYLSPSGVTAMPFNASRVSSAWRASSRLTFWLRENESEVAGRPAGRRTVRPDQRSSISSAESTVMSPNLMGPMVVSWRGTGKGSAVGTGASGCAAGLAGDRSRARKKVARPRVTRRLGESMKGTAVKFIRGRQGVNLSCSNFWGSLMTACRRCKFPVRVCWLPPEWA